MSAADAPPARRRGRLRALEVLLVCAVFSGAGLASWVWSCYSGSLPQTDGALSVEGLAAPVRIERDELGVPTLRAGDRRDLAFACGFAHGQDRFFQMDLLRRHPAGELAELIGPQLLEVDAGMRVHGFRHMAEQAVEALPAGQRALLDAYAAGVESGRRSLRKKPWEYYLLRAEPRAWRPADTMLVVFAMYGMLQGANVYREAAQGRVKELLPPALAELLSPAGSPWDAPLIGPAFEGPEVPPASAIDLRKDPDRWYVPGRKLPPIVRPGSNNWAVDGRHTAHGGAIVACDMHLHLSAPGIWYRAAFVWQGQRVVGATLPGTPAMVVGSNGRIAWGFTNVEADTSDQVILVPAERPDYYRTPDGEMPLKKVEEVIHSNGGPDRRVTVLRTPWGPVIGQDFQGRHVALRWVAYEPGAVNLAMLGLETAGSVEEALTIAPHCGTPAQNLAVADRKGHVGWTVLGRLPKRVGYDGRTPTLSDAAGCQWEGFLPARLYPRLIDPPTGRIWTANNRTVDEPYLSRLGVGTYDHGARAQQIRDDLLAREKLREGDVLAIQLDDRAVFLGRWHELMLSVLSEQVAGGHEGRTALRRQLLYWGGRASVDSAGFRAVRNFRADVTATVLQSLTAPCRRADPTFDYRFLDANVEQSVWLLVTARPAHLLPPAHESWEALLLAAVDKIVGEYRRDPAGYTWGEVNVANIHHPLAPALGPLGKWMGLRMPAEPLPGSSRGMPRIQSPSEGPSQRMAVSPGREEEGYFHAPAGQSGHPLSPHFRDGHEAWAHGKPTPFLPGPAVSVLELRPAG